MSRPLHLLAGACALLVTSLAGCSDREKQEAKVVVDQVDAIELRGDLETRREQVEALDKLELQTEAAKKARDRCADGHRALIAAEENQRVAKDEFGTVEGARAIEKSNEALGEAGDLLQRCNEDVSDLKAKLRDRR